MWCNTHILQHQIRKWHISWKHKIQQEWKHPILAAKTKPVDNLFPFKRKNKLLLPSFCPKLLPNATRSYGCVYFVWFSGEQPHHKQLRPRVEVTANWWFGRRNPAAELHIWQCFPVERPDLYRFGHRRHLQSSRHDSSQSSTRSGHGSLPLREQPMPRTPLPGPTQCFAGP